MNFNVAMDALLLSLLIITSIFYKFERDERVQAEKNAAIAVTTNEANVKALNELQQWRYVLEKSSEQLAAERKEIDKLRKELRSSMQQILKSNNEARKWADTPVPIEFIRMFNDARNGNSISEPRAQTKP